MSADEIVKRQSPYVSISVAASKYLFKHTRTVRRWCVEGKFQSARKMGRDWQIGRTEIMALVAKSHQFNQ